MKFNWNLTRLNHFYPRSPCGERLFTSIVNSTGTMDFYPRSPCGERLREPTALRTPHQISIHALLAESDTVQVVVVVMQALFLSTLSLRRATLRVLDGSKSSIISIHALLAESD